MGVVLLMTPWGRWIFYWAWLYVLVWLAATAAAMAFIVNSDFCFWFLVVKIGVVGGGRPRFEGATAP